MTHTIQLSEFSFDLVYHGDKQYIMLLFDDNTQLYEDNDIVIVEEANTSRFFTVIITRVEYFEYIDKVFQAIDYNKFLPYARSKENAIETIENIPKFKDKARELGVLVFKVTKISNISE